MSEMGSALIRHVFPGARNRHLNEHGSNGSKYRDGKHDENISSSTPFIIGSASAKHRSPAGPRGKHANRARHRGGKRADEDIAVLNMGKFMTDDSHQFFF